MERSLPRNRLGLGLGYVSGSQEPTCSDLGSGSDCCAAMSVGVDALSPSLSALRPEVGDAPRPPTPEA